MSRTNHHWHLTCILLPKTVEHWLPIWQSFALHEIRYIQLAASQAPCPLIIYLLIAKVAIEVYIRFQCLQSTDLALWSIAVLYSMI